MASARALAAASATPLLLTVASFLSPEADVPVEDAALA